MKNLLRLVVVLALAGAVLYVVVLKPRPVVARHLSRGTIIEVALGSGSIESRRMVGVGFEVTARVATMLVDQGDQVTTGQALARLDDRTFRAEVASASEEVALKQSTLERLATEIDRAEAVLEGSHDSLRRVTPLVENRTVPEEELDVAREREQVAVAELARARAALVEGRAARSVAERKLERAEAELARTVLHSPFDGTVVQREREIGDVAVPGSPVLRLAAGDTIWCSVWVDETHLAALRVGATARIVLRSDPEHPHAGRVARIGREVDRETRELLVDVAFDAVPGNIVFGQRVDAWIELSRASDALRLPTALLVRAQGGEGVFVAREGRARFQPIEVGAFGRDFLEVVSGLGESDRVLDPRSSKRQLSEGDRVAVSTRSADEDGR